NCTIQGTAPAVADPLLGPLENNGGTTQTHALRLGSPAISAGNTDGCRDMLGALLNTDQRGFPRFTRDAAGMSRGCDIGAYERFTGSTTTVVAALLLSTRSVHVGTPATLFATIINARQEFAAARSLPPPPL